MCITSQRLIIIRQAGSGLLGNEWAVVFGILSIDNFGYPRYIRGRLMFSSRSVPFKPNRYHGSLSGGFSRGTILSSRLANLGRFPSE